MNAFDVIEQRCPTCRYGKDEYGRVWCSHPYHPGLVNCHGCQWAATCEDFTPIKGEQS